MYRSRSVLLWPSCIITRLNCKSSVSVTSGNRPTMPSACFSASVKAVDLLISGSRSTSMPRFPSNVVLFMSYSSVVDLICYFFSEAFEGRDLRKFLFPNPFCATDSPRNIVPSTWTCRPLRVRGILQYNFRRDVGSLFRGRMPTAAPKFETENWVYPAKGGDLEKRIKGQGADWLKA